MDDNHIDPLAEDTRPYWQKPVPPIRYPGASEDDPLADNGVTLTEEPAPESLQNFDAPHANGAEPPHDPPANITSEPDPLADLPPETDKAAAPADEVGTSASPQASSVLSVPEATRTVHESHQRMALATDAQRTARGNVALALQRFQVATAQTQTFEQLARQHIEASNKERADRVAGRGPVRPQRRLGSAVDSFAYHTRASGRGAGGGRAFSRKAFPASMQGRTIPKG